MKKTNKKAKKKKITFDISGEDYNLLKRISELSGVVIDDVIAVMISSYIIREKDSYDQAT